MIVCLHKYVYDIISDSRSVTINCRQSTRVWVFYYHNYDITHIPYIIVFFLPHQVCCSSSVSCDPQMVDHTWHTAVITHHDNYTVTIDAAVCFKPFPEESTTGVSGVRYLFRNTPCSYKRCAVYSVENDLPALPFVIMGNLLSF